MTQKSHPDDDAAPRWYVVHTQPACEDRASMRLVAQGYHVFCPRLRKTVRHARKSDCERYLPLVVGDGSARTLRVCAVGGMTSLLRPDAVMLRHLRGFESWGRVIEEVAVTTHRLDDIAHVQRFPCCASEGQ